MLLFIDGFENYNVASDMTTAGWSSPNFDTYYSLSTTKQRTGLRCLRTQGASASFSPLTWIPPVERSTLVLGFALMYEDSAFSSGTILTFFDRNGNTNARLQLNSDHSVSLFTVGGATAVATSTLKFTVAMWQFMETKLHVDPTSGQFVVRVFGTEFINYTGNTKHASAPDSVIGSLALRPPGTTMEYLYMDDLYILDTTGLYNNDFLGDCQVRTYRPTGDGSVSDFTPNSGATKYTQVDDAPQPDADTTYISDGTNGHQQLLTHPGVDSLGAIAAVVHTVVARKDSVGVVSEKSLVKAGGTIYKGAARVVGDNYMTFNEVWETNPATGAVWLKAGVDAAEFGTEVVK